MRLLVLPLAAAVVALVAPRPARAAEDPPRYRNDLSTNPIRFGILHFQIEYERVVADRWTIFGAPIFFHHATWYPFAHAPETTANGYGLDLGFRYTFGDAPAGVYVGPLLSAYHGEVRRSGVQTLEGYVFSGGVQAGYTWLLGRLLLSVGGGLSYGVATDRAPEGSPRAADLPHRGVWLNVRGNVGFAF
jgi:hypothetical protein